MPISKRIYPICDGRKINKADGSEVMKAFAAKVAKRIITTWPALILAANRKDRVIGRADALEDSTRTRKGLSQDGAPPGSSIAINFIG